MWYNVNGMNVTVKIIQLKFDLYSAFHDANRFKRKIKFIFSNSLSVVTQIDVHMAEMYRKKSSI